MEEFIIEKVSEILDVDKCDVKVVERLMGGMSNIMHIVEVGGEKFTFRIPGKKANNFVDREIELKNIEIVDSLNVNNETIKFDVEDGYKISRYVEGKCLLDVDYIKYLDEIALILKKIHNSGKKAVNNYNWEDRLKKYEKLLEDEKYEGKREVYFKLKNILINDFNYFKEANLVLCHGDSQVSNFVIGEERVYLLDWEFCGNNDPYYDIACFGNKDFEYALKLLEVYLERKPSCDEIKKLNYFRAFQCLQWHNVALYKYLIGLSEELSVPFFDISNMYLTKAKEFLSNAK